MPIQTYTLKDFTPPARELTCRECGANVGFGVKMDAMTVRAVLTCDNGHRREFDWKVGESPPPEIVAIFGGG